ncbi:hypothetical protein HYALB_00003395 [Hymenoscyphus albidus]|uniref:Uncharacterized protein n=1 Tax=Hymenoscyphus albidus TaxID=595503 RepID=A0A9N9Q6Q3_9HELO|nr:hypothetical protein HYALB_00003395 [Hymenoscyphus albidus]
MAITLSHEIVRSDCGLTKDDLGLSWPKNIAIEYTKTSNILKAIYDAISTLREIMDTEDHNYCFLDILENLECIEVPVGILKVKESRVKGP